MYSLQFIPWIAFIAGIAALGQHDSQGWWLILLGVASGLFQLFAIKYGWYWKWLD
jgi:hypothetical protein